MCFGFQIFFYMKNNFILVRQDHGQRKIYEPRIVTRHDDDEDDVVEEHENKVNLKLF